MKVEGENGIAEEFEADGSVEEAVGLVDGFGGEVNLRAFFGERDALESFFACVGDAHGCAAIGEREHAGVGGGIGAAQAEFIDRCGVDKHGTGVHRIDLRGGFLGVDSEAVGDDDGWTFVAEGDERDRVALAGAFDGLGQDVGYAEFVGDEIELDDAVFEGGIGESASDVGHLVLRNHVGEVHASGGDLGERHRANVK